VPYEKVSLDPNLIDDIAAANVLLVETALHARIPISILSIDSAR
jgi:hypothetical protein